MTALATTEALAEYLGADHDPTDTTAIWALEIASELVRAETHQTFDYAEDVDITLDGTGTDALLLPQLPVTEVTEVTVDDVALAADDWALGDAGMLYRVTGTWPRGRRNVVVTCSHGWVDIPDGLTTLVLLVASRLYRSTGLAGDIQSETIGNYSYTVGETGTTGSEVLTTDERALAARYTVRAFA